MVEEIFKQIEIDLFREKLQSIFNYLPLFHGRVVEFDAEKKKIVIEGDNLNLIINASEDEISYEGNISRQKISGIQKKHKNGYFVKFIKEVEKVKSNNEEQLIDIKYKEDYRLFDNEKSEIYRRRKIKIDNYTKNIKTEEVRRRKPKILENIEATNYTWYTKDGNSMKRDIVKYLYSDDVKEQYDLKDIDKCYFMLGMDSSLGLNEEIDNDIFFKYFKDEVTTEEIKENARKKSIM